MWHEARKHERKLRGMMVDYKKRAERRREYYEKIVSPARHYWGFLAKLGLGNTQRLDRAQFSQAEPSFQLVCVCVWSTADSALRDHSWQDSGDHMGCWGQNSGGPCARQVPCQLYYRCGPLLPSLEFGPWGHLAVLGGSVDC